MKKAAPKRAKKNFVFAVDLGRKRYKVQKKDLSFRPSVYGVIIEDGKVLLSPQWDGYDFPGGGVDLGETMDEALEREVWEETGYKVRRGKILAAENDFFIGPSTGKKFHTIVIYYTCKRVGGSLSIANLDEFEKTYAKKAEWVPLSKVQDLKFYNSVDSVSIIKAAAIWNSKSSSKKRKK